MCDGVKSRGDLTERGIHTAAQHQWRVVCHSELSPGQFLWSGQNGRQTVHAHRDYL